MKVSPFLSNQPLNRQTSAITACLHNSIGGRHHITHSRLSQRTGSQTLHLRNKIDAGPAPNTARAEGKSLHFAGSRQAGRALSPPHVNNPQKHS